MSSQEKTPQISDLQGGSGTANYTAWIVRDKRDGQPKPREMAWPELAELLTTPKVSPEKDGAGIILQNLDGAGRKGPNALSAWAVCLDIEPGTDTETGEIVQPRPFAEVCADVEHNCGWLGAGYTTHSHLIEPSMMDKPKPKGERYRLVFPLDRPVAIATLHKAVLYVAAQLSLPVEAIDPASWSASRLMFLPRHRENFPFRAQAFDGQPLSADLLESLPELATKPAGKPVAQTATLPRASSGNYGQVALQGGMGAIMTASERNNTLNAQALRLYRLALGGHGTEAHVTAALEQAALAAGLPLPEIRATLESARAAANREGPAHPAEREGKPEQSETAKALQAIAARVADAKPEEQQEEFGRCPAPFRGPMAEFVRCSIERQTRKQPAITVAAALGGMSAAMHGRYATGSGLRGNLYVVALAGSTSGKGGPLGLARFIAELAGVHSNSNIGSGQGIEDALADSADSRVSLVIDEVAHMFGSIGNGKGEAYMQAAAKLLLELYSASGSTHVTRLLADGDKRSRAIFNPFLSMFGVTTHDKMQGINQGMIADGTLGRCLIVNGLQRSPMVITDEDLPSMWRAISETTKATAKAIGDYGAPQNFADERKLIYLMTPEAKEFDRKLVEDGNRMEAAADGVKLVLLGRRREQILRVALVLAVWDNAGGEDGRITVEHLEWARDFVTYSQGCLLGFVDNMSDSEVIANGKRIMAMIEGACAGKVTFSGPKAAYVNAAAVTMKMVQHSAVMKKAKLDSRKFKDAIDYLVGIDEISVEDIDGTKFYTPRQPPFYPCP